MDSYFCIVNLPDAPVIVAGSTGSHGGTRLFMQAVAALPKDRPINVLIRRGDWAQYALIRPEPTR